MIDLIHSSLGWMEWIPFMEGSNFGAKVLIFWVVLGIVALVFGGIAYALQSAYYKRDARLVVRASFLVSAFISATVMWIGGLSLLPVSIAALAAMAPDPPPPVAASSTPIKGAGKMDREVVRIKGENRRATVVLYGKREDDSFRVIGYRARIIGSEINMPGSWSLSLPSSFRYSGYSVDSATPIRPDGKWQWGYSTQEGVFSSGATYEFTFDFDSDDKLEGAVGLPMSF